MECDSSVNTWWVKVLSEWCVFTGKWSQQLAPPPSLPHIDSGLTQNPLDGLISLNSLRASTTSRPSHLAASGPAPCKAPKTQLHRSSSWLSEILSKGKVREAKEDRTAPPQPPLPRSLLEMETNGNGSMTAKGWGWGKYIPF